MVLVTRPQVTTGLSDAIRDGYVVRKHPDYRVSNLYWRWCETNGKPFVAISITGARARYATVEYDLFLTSIDGFPRIAVYEILHFILGLNLKPGSLVSVGPILTIATVGVDMAIPAARFFYDSAIDERVCHPPKELTSIYLERSAGGPRPKRAPAVSFFATKKTIEVASTREFWNQLTTARGEAVITR